jgi:hypothetical protein
LSNAVVKFASDKAPLVVLQLEQARRELAQVLIGGVEICGSIG